ncbi:hypothetical protein RJ640_021180 [Escallonia rubra]|uniref:RRM domain-containing protein n=1 Tax=Escallonia rubra TaxID=112253 RepID=A0AA88QJZ6_9ASTE|nr:hypothetical protein RJ640_021180 [Escallonia rubra]
MPPPPSTRPGKAEDGEAPPSNNLWVGNLSADVTDPELASLFGRHGAVDNVTSYPSRSYAFVFFKRLDDARKAKDALQGAPLHGNALKIEFAKPARPCKSLWVGGIGSSVSKEELEEQFLKFGKIQEFKFLRDRNTAFVDFFSLEDASQALKSMNGKRIGSDQIRVDYLRSHPSRREQWPDHRDAREGQFFPRSMGPHDAPWMPQDILGNYSDSSHYESKRQQHPQSSAGRKGERQPSNILWISYPPSVHMDEQMLHNAMILFGEIERIKSFPSRNYSFVEFRSVEEAQRAKEGLQGQLFNDPRISIMYSSSEFAPGKDFSGIYPGMKGPRPEMFTNDAPFRPAQIDLFSHNRPMVPNSFPGHLLPHGIPGPDMLKRSVGPQVSFEPVLPGSEFREGGPNWRRSSPTPGMLSSPSPGVKPSSRQISGTWDVFDASQLQREAKRSRTDGSLSAVDPSFPKSLDNSGLGLDQFFARRPLGKNHVSSLETRIPTGGTGQGHPELDYIWRGVIAKGGSPVCRARCVPIGEGIESEIPEVVNCSARTGLDMLTKHYADAIGFDIIYFLPDSEEDFAPYTEFLRFLGAKDRAGVAKFDDGTTLFLVPPSDFLTNVLNVSGPERLYGVVLRFPQHAPSSTSRHPELVQPRYSDRHQVPYRSEYSVITDEGKVLHTDHNRVLEGSNPPLKSLVPHASESLPMQAATQINNATIPQAGITFTPELLATLASLLPAKESPSGSQLLSVSSMQGTLSSPASAAYDRGPSQGWKHEANGPEQNAHALQRMGSQFNTQTQLQQAYPSISNAPSGLAHGITGNTQIQNPAYNMPQQDGVLSGLATNFMSPPQSAPFSASPYVNQQYQPDILQESRSGYEVAQGTGASGLYSQEPKNPVMPFTQLPNQVQQVQSALLGAGQGASELDDDKNERYRSTLQFAANLLFQIKQQPGTQAGHGSGSH